MRQATLACKEAGANTQTIVFIGDSLAAGYGVKKDEAFPELIAQKLQSEGRSVKVINGVISGSTT